PLGFNNWMITTALIAGFMAKESVVSTLSVLAGAALTSMLSPAAAFFFQINSCRSISLSNYACCSAFFCPRQPGSSDPSLSADRKSRFVGLAGIFLPNEADEKRNNVSRQHFISSIQAYKRQVFVSLKGREQNSWLIGGASDVIIHTKTPAIESKSFRHLQHLSKISCETEKTVLHSPKISS
ncbi:MAG: hypothetical protein IK088_04940, partial [Lachnospiraceae bacterium]|nr:hypothetical protein [Lachnospiraceae bacterium]